MTLDLHEAEVDQFWSQKWKKWNPYPKILELILKTNPNQLLELKYQSKT